MVRVLGERGFFIDSQLVRISGFGFWDSGFVFRLSSTTTAPRERLRYSSSSALILSSLKVSDTQVYEPPVRALLGTVGYIGGCDQEQGVIEYPPPPWEGRY